MTENMKDRDGRPIIVFDVNETLLNAQIGQRW